MDFPFDEEEYSRWLEQSEATLSEAETFLRQGLHHWACFAAQQAAEAACKALLRGFGKPVVTHSMKQLLDALEALGVVPDEEHRHAGRVLERHYKGTRYPDEYEAGTPRDHYDARIAEEAIGLARGILELVRERKAAL